MIREKYLLAVLGVLSLGLSAIFLVASVNRLNGSFSPEGYSYFFKITPAFILWVFVFLFSIFNKFKASAIFTISAIILNFIAVNRPGRNVPISLAGVNVILFIVIVFLTIKAKGREGA